MIVTNLSFLPLPNWSNTICLNFGSVWMCSWWRRRRRRQWQPGLSALSLSPFLLSSLSLSLIFSIHFSLVHSCARCRTVSFTVIVCTETICCNCKRLVYAKGAWNSPSFYLGFFLQRCFYISDGIDIHVECCRWVEGVDSKNAFV